MVHHNKFSIFYMAGTSILYNSLFRSSIFLILIMICSQCADNSIRSGFRAQRSLKITGSVIDASTREELQDVIVNFYAYWQEEGSTTKTNTIGQYTLIAENVLCTELVGTPAEFDPLWFPTDRYFISATKAGYDTVTFGAFAANIHCFDVEQKVNFILTHLNAEQE
jgi:hypothetical protein